ncbi:hypothetical protein [Arsenophonus sp. PmNCSU2021_1]|uniref:hypothetical protein n=1 Tax=Arsenophonus sp. PmNCSU2021_1 TaxID=3118989 RepID=UPI002FF4108A
MQDHDSFDTSKSKAKSTFSEMKKSSWLAADSVSSREPTMQETANNNVSMTIGDINGNGNTVKQRGKKGS